MARKRRCASSCGPRRMYEVLPPHRPILSPGPCLNPHHLLQRPFIQSPLPVHVHPVPQSRFHSPHCRILNVRSAEPLRPRETPIRSCPETRPSAGGLAGPASRATPCYSRHPPTNNPIVANALCAHANRIERGWMKDGGPAP